MRQHSEARIRAGPVLHSGTAPRRGGIPVTGTEALAGGARWAGREFVCLSGGDNVAGVMGAVRRPLPRPWCRGGHGAGPQRMARDVSSRPDAWRIREGAGGKYAAEPLGSELF